MQKKAIVLFSGGTDSTLVAALAAKQKIFNEIILLTYEVPVSCMEGNSKRNVPNLEKAFPNIQFTHTMIPIEKIINKVLTKKKFQFVLKHGLIESSFCLQCRLSMHIRTIMYCLDNNIQDVFDGSNITLSVWIDQSNNGVELVDQLYKTFGITIKHPVFNYGGDDILDLLKYLNKDDLKNVVNKSTSEELYKMKIIEKKDHKTDFSKSYTTQPICLGIVMTLIHSFAYSLPFKNFYKLNNEALNWYRNKTGLYKKLLKEYENNRNDSELGRLI